ncbi:MAG: ornithine cyclodeaminase family protein, partial [Hyphomicrobiales bacterium]|nr:ornithine cyclodeaminase family protein [Hyphomicrobiales bacterium]
PSIHGTYLLISGEDGGVLSALDGARLTLWRTAAASALAAKALARKDARRMVMVGAGALAPFLIRAHAAVRPIAEVSIWNRSRSAAEEVAEALTDQDFAVTVCDDLAAAVAAADIVSAATLSSGPLIRGEWLKPGTHVDLVGAFRPDMRESDDEAISRARIFVDTRAGAPKEGGDIAIPLAAGLITEADIVADLFELCRGTIAGRQSESEITLFKSVGTAIEDLAAAILVHSQLG